MSTTTTLPIAFRCNKCWQLTIAESEQAGTTTPCVCCATPLVVPEATPERLEAGRNFVDEAMVNPQHALILDEDVLSDQEIYQAVEAERKQNGPLSARVAGRFQRFFGAVIDALATCFAFGIGVFLAIVVVGEPGELSTIVVLTIPLMLGICQCVLIATEGRTIGKYCVRTKIVGLDQQPPGFFQGVLLRVFAVGLLGIVPFFGLIDAVWIFTNDSNRCLHDFIAGTYVVDA